MEPGKPAIIKGLRGWGPNRQKTGAIGRYQEEMEKGGPGKTPKNPPTTRGKPGEKAGDPDNATP